jgi:hypothetical protein
MGGDAWATSPGLGQGTTFNFTARLGLPPGTAPTSGSKLVELFSTGAAATALECLGTGMAVHAISNARIPSRPRPVRALVHI